MADPHAYDVDVAACRGRQRRLLERMRRDDVDLVIVTRNEHVQWLSGPRFSPLFQSAAALTVDGELTLAAPHKAPDEAAADQIVVFPAKYHSTMRDDQRRVCHEALGKALQGRATPRRLGVEFSGYGRHEPVPTAGELVDIEPLLFHLRRRKDPDELARIRKAIEATRQMYLRAREVIRPGVEELTVFNELQTAAVQALGEPLTGTGNDYQCGSRGGPPRDGRRAESGELYILDLGPAFRGYYADNARTLPVDSVSDEQEVAFDFVRRALEHVEARTRPGVSAKRLFAEVQEILDQAPVGVFNHHLGHGIGLFPHEAPRLNPHWDDVFEVGDVFTAEPGLYDPRLRAGLRIENDYLVTEHGVERLSDFEA